MNQDDLKRFSVIVGGGSGCLFQPMTKDYTYILTAKHLFFDDVEDEHGKITSIPKEDGSKILIQKQIQIQDTWSIEIIPFILIEGETYFPHKEADIAVLKIIPALGEFDFIISQDSFMQDDGFALCGYPTNTRGNHDSREYTLHRIENFIASNNYFHSARLFGTLRQEDIEGMSGCGILKLTGDFISIIGIQSKMGNLIFPAGEIGFVPIKYADEIIEYGEYSGKLNKLLPIHLINFEFLRDGSFLLEVDAIDEEDVSCARITLRNKALNIIQSDITPYGIKQLFNERLLISEKDCECLSQKMIWIAWLEFLTVMNIVKYEKIESSMLSDIFDCYRLKYANIDDWTGLFRTDLLKSDYIGLQPNSTVIVSTRKPPKRNFLIPKGRMIDILKVYDKKGFRTNKGIDPYTSFNFVHLDYFKTECILEKIEQYKNMNEEQLLEKLKQEYHDLFD